MAPSEKRATSDISDDAEKQLAPWQRGPKKRIFPSNYRNEHRDHVLVHGLSWGLFILIVASVPGCASNFKAPVGPEYSNELVRWISLRVLMNGPSIV